MRGIRWYRIPGYHLENSSNQLTILCPCYSKSLTRDYVIKRSGSSSGIEERIEEAKGRFSSSYEPIVKQSDDACENRTRAAGPRDRPCLRVDDNLNIFSLCRNVGKATTAGIEFTSVRLPESG